MSEIAENLKPILASLSADDRAMLSEYLHSLETNGDADDDGSLGELDPDYVDEINRRVADSEAGKTVGIPGNELMKRLKEKYG